MSAWQIARTLPGATAGLQFGLSQIRQWRDSRPSFFVRWLIVFFCLAVVPYVTTGWGFWLSTTALDSSIARYVYYLPAALFLPVTMRKGHGFLFLWAFALNPLASPNVFDPPTFPWPLPSSSEVFHLSPIPEAVLISGAFALLWSPTTEDPSNRRYAFGVRIIGCAVILGMLLWSERGDLGEGIRFVETPVLEDSRSNDATKLVAMPPTPPGERRIERHYR